MKFKFLFEEKLELKETCQRCARSITECNCIDANRLSTDSSPDVTAGKTPAEQDPEPNGSGSANTYCKPDSPRSGNELNQVKSSGGPTSQPSTAKFKSAEIVSWQREPKGSGSQSQKAQGHWFFGPQLQSDLSLSAGFIIVLSVASSLTIQMSHPTMIQLIHLLLPFLAILTVLLLTKLALHRLFPSPKIVKVTGKQALIKTLSTTTKTFIFMACMTMMLCVFSSTLVDPESAGSSISMIWHMLNFTFAGAGLMVIVHEFVIYFLRSSEDPDDQPGRRMWLQLVDLGTWTLRSALVCMLTLGALGVVFFQDLRWVAAYSSGFASSMESPKAALDHAKHLISIAQGDRIPPAYARLADAYIANDQRAEAKHELHRVIDMIHAGQPNVLLEAQCLERLASVAKSDNDWQSAEKYEQQALEFVKTHKPTPHDGVRMFLDFYMAPQNFESEEAIQCNLADLYLREKKFSQAEALYKQNLQKCEDLERPDWITISHALDAYGDCLKKVGRSSEIAPAIMQAHNKIEHSQLPLYEYALAETELADLLVKHQDFADAEVLLKKALDHESKEWGAESTQVVSAKVKLGDFYAARGREKEAESTYKTALDLAKKLANDNASTSYMVSEVERPFSAFYIKTGNLNAAKTMLDDAFERDRQEYGDGAWYVADDLLAYAQYYRATGQLEKASDSLDKAAALDIVKKSRSQGTWQASYLRERAALLKAMKRLDESAKLEKEAEALEKQ